MSGGGKGGSQTSTTQIPAWLEDAARQNIGRADVLSTIGYTPYYGPEVAAMTPSQIAAMQGTNQAASAFGLNTVDPMAGMPQAQDFNGISAYSSADGFQEALAQLMAQRPGQYAALTEPFIDPVTGAAPSSPFGALMAPQRPQTGLSGLMSNRGGDGDSDRTAPHSGGAAIGGYTGLRDMFDGGGPGASGSTFSGGGRISSGLNAVGVRPAGSGGSSSGMGGGK